jgi:hypothetical protein
MRMRNFDKLMLSVVVVALFCDLVAGINTDNREFDGTSLRGGASPQRDLWFSKKDKKEKSMKYDKGSKGYKGKGYYGDDDDDGGGKGAKKYDKYSNKYKHDRMSDSSSSDSSSDSSSTQSRIDYYDVSQSVRKERDDDERNPEDESDHIEDYVRGIVPDSKPERDGSPPTIEDDGTVGETTPIESPTDEPTESPIEDPTRSQTEGPTDTIEIVTGAIEPDFSSLIEQGSRTVQIKHPGTPNKCMTYDYVLDNMAVFMEECSTINSRNDDYWEILQITTADEGDLFHLRHKSTQLCIPINSENPEMHFNCFRYFGMNEAVADSFTGLVDCNSDFAAAFEIGSSRSLYMSNSGCEEAAFADQGVVLMTYNQAELTDKIRVVVWGGQNLLELEDVVEEYNFNSEWVFVDV